MRNHWIDERAIEDDLDRIPRGRNTDSSVAAQYEDSVPPDPNSDAVTGDDYEPS